MPSLSTNCAPAKVCLAVHVISSFSSLVFSACLIILVTLAELLIFNLLEGRPTLSIKFSVFGFFIVASCLTGSTDAGELNGNGAIGQVPSSGFAGISLRFPAISSLFMWCHKFKYISIAVAHWFKLTSVELAESINFLISFLKS